MRRSPKRADDQTARWFVSGVGSDIAWEGRAPPWGFDIRDANNVGQEDTDVGDEVVAYTARYVY